VFVAGDSRFVQLFDPELHPDTSIRDRRKAAFRLSSEGPHRFGMRKGRKTPRPPNQALQTTSVTPGVFGKVSVFDRHRLGV